MIENKNVLYIILAISGIILIFLRSKKGNTDVSLFFERYIKDDLSEEETTAKINEIANINSQYPIDDKKIAQALLRLYNELN